MLSQQRYNRSPTNVRVLTYSLNNCNANQEAQIYFIIRMISTVVLHELLFLRGSRRIFCIHYV